jgi:hypothetical protein
MIRLLQDKDLIARVTQLELLVKQLQAAQQPRQHAITRRDDMASCSCGWSFHHDDPGVMQTAVSTHYRDLTAQRGRKSWPVVKTALEKEIS